MNSRSLLLVYYHFVRFALGAFGRKFSLHCEGTCIAAEHWERRGREWDTKSQLCKGGRMKVRLDFAFVHRKGCECADDKPINFLK